MTLTQTHPFEVLTGTEVHARFSNLSCAIRTAADPDIRGWVRGPFGLVLLPSVCRGEARLLEASGAREYHAMVS